MNMTFQHKMAENFYYKLRKHFWINLSPEEVLMNKQAMNEAKQILQFGGDVTQQFINRLASLPVDRIVIQMMIANFDPSNSGRGQIFVTRISHEQEPITVGLPSHRNQFLAHAKKAYNIASINLSNTLSGNMKPILDVLKYLQDMFLAGHKWLLRGQLDCVRQQSVRSCLDDAGRRAVDTILHQHDYLISYQS